MVLRSRELQATLLLVGTIVGVGMFGIPFVFSRSGFLTGAVLLAVLAAAVTIVHLAYAEVVARTSEIHRLPGYVRRYLGRNAGWLSSASYLFGLSGTLLAYLILGGAFLGNILAWLWPSVPDFFGPLTFYLLGIGVIFRSIRFESLVNAVLTLGLAAAIVVLGVTLLPAISIAHLAGFNPSRIFVPYGVLLFSLAGAAIIPDMRRLIGETTPVRMRRIVIFGTIFAAVLYLLFALAVVGASSGPVTPDAITGLAERFGPGYLVAGSLIGFLATITSFITLGLVLEGMFISDFMLKPRAAWLLVAVIPLLLYLAGFQDFIAIISLVGAMAIGLDSILILFIHARVPKSPKATGTPAAKGGSGMAEPAPAGTSRLIIPGPLRLLLILIFSAGVLYELASFITVRF